MALRIITQNEHGISLHCTTPLYCTAKYINKCLKQQLYMSVQISQKSTGNVPGLADQILKLTHREAAPDAASVRFGPSVRGPISLFC